MEYLKFNLFKTNLQMLMNTIDELKSIRLRNEELELLYEIIKNKYAQKIIHNEPIEYFGRRKIEKLKNELSKNGAYSFSNVELSEASYRKIAKIIKKLFFTENFSKTKKLINDVFAEFEDLKTIRNKAFRNEKSTKSALERLLHKIENNDSVFYSLLKDSVNKIKIRISKSFKSAYFGSGSEDVALLLLSDWHILELVSPEEINFVNKFDINVAVRRVEKIVEKTVKIVNLHRMHSRIEKLYVWLGGDMVSGNIHDELVKYGNFTITEQIALTGYLIAALIKELSQNFKEIEVFTVVGNHGRIQKRKEYKKRFNSYDYIAYQIAALLVRELKNVKWEINKSIFAFKEIKGFKFCFSHGDEIKSWGGIPFYGLRRDFSNKQNVNFYMNNFDKTTPLIYYVVGHFHIPSILYDGAGYIIMNGTLKGVDEYSFSRGWLTRPSQKLLLINESVGIECVYDLWLDDEHWSEMTPQRYNINIPDNWAEFFVI